MLSERVPEAMLRIRSDVDEPRDMAFFTLPPDGRVAASLPSVDERTASRLRHVSSPSRTVPFGRAAPVCVARGSADSWSYHRQVSTRLILPNLEDDATSAAMDGQWLDAYDAFITGGQFAGLVADSVNTAAVRRHWPWQEADSLLASVWLALRTAVDLAPAVRSTKGGVLLGLGSGLAAELHITATTRDVSGLRAMIDCDPSKQDPITTSIDAGVDSVKYSVPAGLVLLAGRTRAEIHFTASPLLLGLGTPMVLVAAARSAQAAADEAARRAAYDDDDD
jgi:hypothetical protein